MRVSVSCKLRLLGVLLCATLASGCMPRPRVPPPAVAAPPPVAPAPHLGTPYAIIADQSLLTILVYRGGPLASAGHNHVIASHALVGSFYLPADLTRASLEVVVPVSTLTVDEPQLRALENPADFPADVPESTRAATRRNMLSEALLDAAQFPDMQLRALSLQAQGRLTGSGGEALALVEITVRAVPHAISVPVHYELREDTLVAEGQLALKQSDLGLTPFSAMLGALVVQDEMRVRFHIVARRAGAPPQ